MKRIICTLLSLLVLSLCACTNTVQPDTGDSSTETAKRNKKLSYDCNADFYWDAAWADGRTPVPDAKAAYSRFSSENFVQKPFKTGNYVLADIVPLRESEVSKNEKLYAKCGEWLAANYSSACCTSKEEMQKGIENRFSFLTESLKQSLESDNYALKQADTHFEPAVFCEATEGKSGNFSVAPYLTKYTLGSESYTGCILSFYIPYRGSTSSFLPAYITENDVYAPTTATATDNGTPKYSADVEISVEVLLDRSSNIADFRQMYKKNSSEKIHYWIFDESGTKSGTDSFYLPPEPAGLSDYSVQNTRLSEKSTDAIAAGLKFYKGLISLGKEDFPELSLSSELDKTVIDSLVSDAKKYGVKFEIDPTCAKDTENQRFSYIYKSEKHGEVYMVQRKAYMKTGSEDFNKKYGLNTDRQASTVNIYLFEDNGEFKICAVKIFSSSVPESEETLNEFWSGNGGKG